MIDTAIASVLANTSRAIFFSAFDWKATVY
jgi:hypothetical protein